VSLDEQHIALPTLYGAPAYARPPSAAIGADRPFDPDELPIEADQSDEEREFTSTRPVRTHASDGSDPGRAGSSGSARHRGRRPRSFSLRTIAGRMHRNG
jgi:hypothetical protein